MFQTRDASFHAFLISLKHLLHVPIIPMPPRFVANWSFAVGYNPIGVAQGADVR
jgi:hypothetical protein